jgi:hypothetical protein
MKKLLLSIAILALLGSLSTHATLVEIYPGEDGVYDRKKHGAPFSVDLPEVTDFAIKQVVSERLGWPIHTIQVTHGPSSAFGAGYRAFVEQK